MTHDTPVEIIPAINAEIFAEVERRIRLVEPFVRWVHLDIADGTFTPNILWHDPADLASFKTPLAVELHLMIARPEDKIASWLVPGVKRVIVHHETLSDADIIMDACGAAGVETGIAIATETPWTALQQYFGKTSFFQILAVRPGRAGQEFQASNYDKIRDLRTACPSCTIEVDGGVKIGVARQCVEAGANILAAASAIFGEKDI